MRAIVIYVNAPGHDRYWLLLLSSVIRAPPLRLLVLSRTRYCGPALALV